MAGGLVAREVQADQRALRVRLALDERVLADEVLVDVECHGEADAGLERVDLVVELVAGEDQARLDAEHVKRVEPERDQALRRARRHHRVPHGLAVVGVAEDLVAELAAVAGARDDERDAVVGADPADEEAEPLELLELRLGRGRPDELLQDLAAQRPLDRDVVQLVGRRLDPHAQAALVGDLLEVHARVRVAADEAEVVVGHAEDRRVVDHAAGLVADRGVDDLADREPARVARDRRLDERLGVRAQHLPLAQRREVHDDGLLAARPVLLDRALVGEAGRKPVAAVLGDVAGQLRPAGVEGGLLRHDGL